MSVINLPLVEENKHVKELAEILNKGGRGANAKGLLEVFNHICSMERDLGKAIDELTAMRQELSVMRDEQKHPIKTMLHKAADSLMLKLKSVLKQILSVKDKFIDGCKQAVEAVKDKGIIAANDFVGALNIKGDLEAARNTMNNNIAFCEKQIAKIENACAEYHAAGRAIKNVGRLIAGKEPIPEIKPNGKLAQLLQAPFRGEISHQKRCLGRNSKALARIDKLEKAAEQSAARSRSSVVDEIKRHSAEKSQANPEIAAAKKTKTAGQEL